MAATGEGVVSSTQRPAKRVHLDIDDAFLSGEDEPGTFDLKVAAATSRRQLEEHEQAIPIDESQHADDVPPSAVTPAWSIHAYTGASTSTIDLTIEPNPRSPFAQDTFNIDEDVPYTRRPFASPHTPEGTSLTSPAGKDSPPHEPVQDTLTEEISAISLHEISLQGTTHGQGPSPAFGDRRESNASQGSLPASNGQPSTSSRPPVEICVPTWPPPEALKSPSTAFDEKFKQMKKSSGPSILQKVVSRTRPTHLPPKPHEEDTKHQKDWEEMMRLSREAGKHDARYHWRASINVNR
jgi:TBC1 domain family member 14